MLILQVICVIHNSMFSEYGTENPCGCLRALRKMRPKHFNAQQISRAEKLEKTAVMKVH